MRVGKIFLIIFWIWLQIFGKSFSHDFIVIGNNNKLLKKNLDSSPCFRHTNVITKSNVILDS